MELLNEQRNSLKMIKVKKKKKLICTKAKLLRILSKINTLNILTDVLPSIRIKMLVVILLYFNVCTNNLIN